jgi:general secretion pathway protein B
MSYILDALRKSDQQRQRYAAPTLLTLQPSAVVRKRPAFLSYGLLAAVLIGTGIVIGWLRPWQTEQAVPAKAEPVAAKPLESTPREPAPAQPEMAPQPKPEQALQNAPQPAQPAVAPSEMAPQPKPTSKRKPELSARAQPQTDGSSREAEAPAPGRTAAPAAERPADSDGADDAGGQTVISMAELPSAILQALPAMKISVHAYSDNPAARLVGIGNKILHEGDYVAPDLQLERITQDGMIFSYKGYRFRRAVR